MSKRRKEDGLYKRADSPYIWASYTGPVGKRIRCSTGTTDPREAEEILAKWKVEARNVRHWGEEPTRIFDDLMVGYLKETKDLKRSADRDLHITVNLKGFFGGMVLNSLGSKDVKEYIKWRRTARDREAEKARKREAAAKAGSLEVLTKAKPKRKMKPIAYSTIRRELSLLSSAINYARDNWDWDIPNTVEKRKPATDEDRVRWLRPSEAQKLIEAARSEPRAPHLSDFIILGLHTGCRSQEILGLEWDRVDFEQRLIYLPYSKNKSRRNTSVPINEVAVEVLMRRKRFRDKHCPSSRWVFSDKEGERIASVKKSFATACKRAGIEDFRPHDLRHTCAAWLVQAGVPLIEVRDLLRHTSYQVTEKYAHLEPKQTRGAVGVLNERYGMKQKEAMQALENATAIVDTSRSGHVRPKLTVIAGGKQ